MKTLTAYTNNELYRLKERASKLVDIYSIEVLALHLARISIINTKAQQNLQKAYRLYEYYTLAYQAGIWDYNIDFYEY